MNQPTLLPPETQWPIVGHILMVKRLRNALEGDMVRHAYLLTGPEQIGKSTLARVFAQALLCTQEAIEHRPCGQCRTCKLVAANRHPDLLTLDMAWQEQVLNIKGTAVSVDAVRHLNSELTRRPHEGRYKVVLIPDADKLTPAAANAFLKTLEEPPAYVVMILTTRDSDLLLPTIRSRCQSALLMPVPTAEIEQALITRHSLSPDQASLIARLSGGRVGWALTAAQERTVLSQRAAALDTVRQAWQVNRAERLKLAQVLGKTHDDSVMPLWASWWRDVLLLQQGADDAIQNSDQRDYLHQAATRCPPEQVRSFLHDLKRLRRIATETNANPTLIWETLMLKVPHAM